MHFNWISIKNFGPYKDEEKITFSKDKGVYIIWGDNGRGKTSILNALSFLFFDEVGDRVGKDNDYLEIINKLGQREGNYSFEVSLDATDEVISNGNTIEEHYLVTRTVDVRDGISVPTKNEDFISYLFVKKDGNILDSTSAKHIVDNIIPKDVARFFLFDGELLEEYATLLKESSAKGEIIKESIEQILGLPILTFGNKDATTAYEKYSSEAIKIAANDEETAKYVKHLDLAKQKRGEHLAEKTRLEGLLEDELKNKKRISEELKKNENYRKLLAEKEAIKGKIQGYEEDLQKSEEEAVNLLGEAWRWMLKGALEDKRSILNTRADELNSKKKEKTKYDTAIFYYELALKECDCPICSHTLSKEDKEKLLKKIEEVKDKKQNLSPEETDELNKINKELSDLSMIDTGVDKSSELKAKMLYISDIRVKISDCKETELKNVQEELDTYTEDEKEILKLVQDSTTCENQIQIYNEGIRAERGKIEELDDSIADYNRKIISLSKNKDVKTAEAKAKYVENIKDIFSKAIDRYRDKLKNEVERDATEIFQAMNDEPEYSVLKINDNYGLSIIGTDGEPVPNRSAGWEHIVAFSLMGALHKNAPLQGPVIMDSPFMRMSRIKKPKMVESLPLLSEQVMLFVFPGEIDERDARVDLREKLLKEYTIKRITSKHSEIVEGGI